ncbi:hypothetical protein SUDANB58_03198 [Streptomyces sp. enrichment culture]
MIRAPEDGPGQFGRIGEIMNFRVHSAGAEWTRALVEHVRGGAYAFAGEGEPFAGVLGEGSPYATGAALRGRHRSLTAGLAPHVA